jgi:hypothetical protein
LSRIAAEFLGCIFAHVKLIVPEIREKLFSITCGRGFPGGTERSADNSGKDQNCKRSPHRASQYITTWKEGTYQLSIKIAWRGGQAIVFVD